MPTFSKKRCIQGCERFADAHERALCCADCQALHLAMMRKRSRQAALPKPVAATPRSRRGRRFGMLFGAAASPAKAPTKAKRAGAPQASRARRGGGLAGVPPLRDAEDDRRDARSIAAGIASSGVLICNALYPEAGEEEGAAARRQAREQCAAAIQALHASANGIIDAATRDRGAAAAAEIEAALEEMRLHVEGVQDQAEARDREKAAARQREEEQRRQDEDDKRNRMLLIGGGIAAVAVAGVVGYVVLQDDDGAKG